MTTTRYPCGECGQMVGTEQHTYEDCKKWRASLADATVTTTVNEAREAVKRFIPESWDAESMHNFMWRVDEYARLVAAERAIGAEVLVGCYHGQPHRCSRCGFEWPAARLTRERNGQTVDPEFGPHAPGCDGKCATRAGSEQCFA